MRQLRQIDDLGECGLALGPLGLLLAFPLLGRLCRLAVPAFLGAFLLASPAFRAIRRAVRLALGLAHSRVAPLLVVGLPPAQFAAVFARLLLELPDDGLDHLPEHGLIDAVPLGGVIEIEEVFARR